MADCEMLARCGFFKKYQDTLDLACRGFMAGYCRGAKQTDCERRKYRQANGCSPDDDMLPSGHMMPSQFSRRSPA